MVEVPPGRFVIGSPEGEAGRDRSRAWKEGPPRTVAIHAFAIGLRPVTRGEWATFVVDIGRAVRGGCAWSGLPGNARRDGSNADASWRRLGFEQEDGYPVVCVTWSDAQDYVAWLTRRTGHR